MTEKHAFLVSGDDIKPFYTDESLAELKHHFDDSPYVKIVNCEWAPESWQIEPYYYTLGRAGYREYYALRLTERANHLSFSPAGIKQDGAWLEKYYADTAGDDDWTSFKWHSDGHCFALHAGCSYKRRANGVWTIMGAVEPIEIGKHPPEQLIPQARRMKAEKWGGFYDDIVEYLINDGMDELQI